jgi:myotubularin-related protein 3/4
MFTLVKTSEMFPKPQLIRDPTSRDDVEISIPFVEIPGEAVTFLGEISESEGIIALSNYRLHISKSPSSQSPQQQQLQQSFGNASSSINVPLTSIERVEVRDLFFLHVVCKDARFYLLQFSDSLTCKEWGYRISAAITQPTTIEQVHFAFLIDFISFCY